MTRRLVLVNLVLAVALAIFGHLLVRAETVLATGDPAAFAGLALYAGGGHPIVYQPFEITMLPYVAEGNAPTAYGVTTSTGSGAFWGRTAARAAAGIFSAWAAGEGPNAPPPYGYPVPPNTNTTMLTGPHDLTPYVEGELRYDLWLSTEINDLYTIGASVDGVNYVGYSFYGTSQGFEGEAFNLQTWPGLGDLTAYSTVWFRFGYSSDASYLWQGAYVDNVRLHVREPGEVFHDAFLLGDTSRWSSTVD